MSNLPFQHTYGLDQEVNEVHMARRLTPGTFELVNWRAGKADLT